MEKQPTWIRIAGNATNIKAGHPRGWRFYVKGTTFETPLKNWSIVGDANHKNFIPGTNAKGDDHGIVAWIDCFGVYTVDNETLYITLENPIPSQSTSKAQQ